MHALALRGMGLVYLARGEPALALPSLEQALAILQTLGVEGDAAGDMDAVLVATARETATVMAALGRPRMQVKALGALALRVEARLAAATAGPTP